MPDKKIAILGGGLAGLSAALYLVKKGYTEKFGIHIFEKDSVPGGLVAGKIINNNFYEYGPHFFHTNNPEILKIVKEIADDVLLDFNRTILIKFMDNYFTFPLSIVEVFKKLPKSTVFKAVLSLVKHNLLRVFTKPEITDSEVLLIGYYGKILYELFFKNYIFHVWGIYPKDFSPKFAEQRIPRISGSIFLNKIISPLRARFSKGASKDFIENVEGKLYTTRDGYRGITQRIIDLLQKNGIVFHLNSEVKEIITENNRVKKVITAPAYQDNKDEDLNKKNTENISFECNGAINTLPINEVVLMFKPEPPQDIKEASAGLHYRSLVFIGVLVNKPRILPVSFMYFREHSFNRIYDSSYFGHDTFTPNTTILVAELSTSTADRWWNDEEYCRKMVIKDLLQENIINSEDIIEVHVYK